MPLNRATSAEAASGFGVVVRVEIPVLRGGYPGAAGGVAQSRLSVVEIQSPFAALLTYRSASGLPLES